MKVVQVAMLIILTLLTVYCGFYIIRGQQSEMQRIDQGKPQFFLQQKVCNSHANTRARVYM